MKVNFFLIIAMLGIMGCRSNESSFVCRIVSGSTDLIDCHSKKDRKFRFYFTRDKKVEGALSFQTDRKCYEDIKFNLKGRNYITSLQRIEVIPDKTQPSNHFLILFDTTGKLLTKKMYHEEINEGYRRIKVKDGYSYQVLYYLANLNEEAPVYYFTLSGQGEVLPDFFFYRKNNDNSYSIVTDDELLTKKGMIDSLEIEYSEIKMKEMKFVFEEERNAYFPIFKGKTNIITTIDSLIRYEKEPSIVGTMWFFLPKNNEYKTAYNLLIFNGDLMSRVKKYSYLFDKYEKKYPTGKISELKDLKKSLLQVGFIEKNGGFEPSSDLLEKIQGVINGSKNNAHSKGS